MVYFCIDFDNNIIYILKLNYNISLIYFYYGCYYQKHSRRFVINLQIRFYSIIRFVNLLIYLLILKYK